MSEGSEKILLRAVAAARRGRTPEALAAARAALVAIDTLPDPEVLAVLAALPEVRAEADLADSLEAAAALVRYARKAWPDERPAILQAWRLLRGRRPGDALIEAGWGVLRLVETARLADPVWTEAAEAFRTARAADESLEAAAFGLAAALILGGRAEAGLTALRDFVRRAPRPARLRTRWAVAWLAALGAALEGQPEAAEALVADFDLMPAARSIAETLAVGRIDWLAREYLVMEAVGLWLRDLAQSDRWSRLPVPTERDSEPRGGAARTFPPAMADPPGAVRTRPDVGDDEA